MEFSKSEVLVVESTEKRAQETSLLELDALQLAAVGGGSADVHFG